jgi:hypothetical protein
MSVAKRQREQSKRDRKAEKVERRNRIAESPAEEIQEAVVRETPLEPETALPEGL